MNQVQFKGYLRAVSANYAAGEMVLRFETALKNISESDRELLGAWCTLEDPEVMVTLSPTDRAVVVLDALMAGARVDLAKRKVTITVKAPKSMVTHDDEEILGGLARYPVAIAIEISCSQLTLFSGG